MRVAYSVPFSRSLPEHCLERRSLGEFCVLLFRYPVLTEHIRGVPDILNYLVR